MSKETVSLESLHKIIYVFGLWNVQASFAFECPLLEFVLTSETFFIKKKSFWSRLCSFLEIRVGLYDGRYINYYGVEYDHKPKLSWKLKSLFAFIFIIYFIIS